MSTPSSQDVCPMEDGFQRVQEAFRDMLPVLMPTRPNLGGENIEADILEFEAYLRQREASMAQSRHRGCHFWALACVQALRFKRLGDRKYLEDTIYLFDNAIQCLRINGEKTSQMHEYKHERDHLRMCYYDFAQILNSDYCLNHVVGSIESAFGCAKKALAITPLDNPHYQMISILLRNQFQTAMTNPDCMDNFIDTILPTTPEGHSGESEDLTLPIMDILATMLSHRWRLTGSAQDLELSKKLGVKVFEATNKDDPEYGTRAHKLAQCHANSYFRTANQDDLHLAIDFNTTALAFTPKEDEKVELRADLAFLFVRRFLASGDFEDLDQAIKLIELCANSTLPAGNSQRAYSTCCIGRTYVQLYTAMEKLNSCGHELLPKYRRFHSDSLENGISYLKMSVDTTNAVLDTGRLDTNAGNLYREIATALTLRYIEQENFSDFTESVKYWTQLYNNCSTPTLERVEAAQEAAELYIYAKKYPTAKKYLKKALALLSMVSSQSFQRDDQLVALSRVSGLASTAAACVLQVKAPLRPSPPHPDEGVDVERAAKEALRVLELGRGIIMSLSVDLRTDVSTLKEIYPKDFEYLESLRNQLSENAPMMEALVPDVSAIAKRQHIKERHDQLELTISMIRRNPGFERFLKRSTSGQMMQLARDGAIVVVNGARMRLDALIITKDRVQLLPLDIGDDEETFFKKMEKVDMNMAQVDSKKRRGVNKQLLKALESLWEFVVHPICNELGLGSREEGLEVQKKPMRVWWIGVGRLSKVPFHAAGVYSGQNQISAMELINSSYIPTVKVLWYAAQDARAQDSLRAHNGGRGQVHVNLIGMPDTPGQGILPSVEKELESIREITTGRGGILLRNVEPTKGQVQQCLAENTADADGSVSMRVVHFACHGLSDPVNPLESHVVLFEDPPSSISTEGAGPSLSPRAAKLSVREISTFKVKNAFLAYLSACHTANNSKSELADEGIHVVSGFQMAGFRHVIGNLWKADDESCQIMSRAFYEHLLANDLGADKDNQVAEAFHAAVRKVMEEQGAGDFVSWIPFIHSGL